MAEINTDSTSHNWKNHLTTDKSSKLTTLNRIATTTCQTSHYYAESCDQREPANRNQQTTYQTAAEKLELPRQGHDQNKEHDRCRKMKVMHAIHSNFFFSCNNFLSWSTVESTSRQWRLCECSYWKILRGATTIGNPKESVTLGVSKVKIASTGTTCTCAWLIYMNVFFSVKQSFKKKYCPTKYL